MRLKILILAIFLSLFSLGLSQNPNQIKYENFFTLSPIDYPYTKVASELYPKGFLLSPSMKQALAVTESFYNLGYWLYSKINWDKITKKPLYQYLAKISGFYLLETILTYFPGGSAWLHEEFHRSILTDHFIYSYDQVYSLPIFASTISVNNVSDQDLIRFKANYPIDFIRLSEAGIEGEYLLIKQLQKRNFFLNQTYPFYISELTITLNSIFYVFMCHTDLAIEQTEKFNQQETEIPQRDFVGLDFTAWVYDLFRPNEPYQDRGIHPSGNGIDRYIKPNDLTPEEYRFLKLQGYLQIINVFSPFIFGVNEINTPNGTKFNFSLRHYLTSFGYDINPQFFIKKSSNFILSLHLFRNYIMWFPGFEFELFNQPLTNNTFISVNAICALQPQDLQFKTRSPMIVGYMNFEISKFFRHLGFSLNLSLKNRGWIPGEIYQTSSINLGFSLKYKN